MELTHFNRSGQAKMVDVTDKAETKRVAVATGKISMLPETLALIQQGRAAKGDVLAVAQVAGVMAAKRTWEIIPMCHPLLLTGVDLQFAIQSEDSSIQITATVTTTGKTGVEMEALTAVSTAALTIYDMCKSVDRGMTIEHVMLQSKSGGKSGEYQRNIQRSAEIVAVCTSKNKGERKTNVGVATLLPGLGLSGDAHAGFQHRQVSLLALESIEKMQKMGLDVHPGDFAENLTVRGIDLVSLPVGTKIRINDALLEVSQIGKECHTRCAIYYQAGDCVMPKEGIFAIVLQGGLVSVGDRLEVLGHV